MPRTQRQLAKQRQEVRSSGLKKLIIGGVASFLMLQWVISAPPSASRGAYKLISLSPPLLVGDDGVIGNFFWSPFFAI